MGFAIEERLERLLTNPPRKLSRSVVLALRKNYGHKKGVHKGSPKSKDNKDNGNSGQSGYKEDLDNHAENHNV